jgi:hypothetical protein
MVKKIKLFCNRPPRPIGMWDVEAPTFSRQSTHRWRWGCQPYAPAALLPPGRFLLHISVRDWVEPWTIVRLEGLGQLKPPMTSSGIESATLWLVTQCLNQLRYATNWKERGRKLAWLTSMYYPGIRLAGLEGDHETLSQTYWFPGRDSNEALPKYKTECLSPAPPCSIPSISSPSNRILELLLWNFLLWSRRTAWLT